MFWRAASLSLDHASEMSGRVFGVIGPHLPSSRKMARNFRQAFPAKSPAEIADLIRGAWANLGRVVAEFPHLARLGDAEWTDRVEVVGEEHIADYRARNQAAIYFSGHLGNWEIAALTSVRLGVPMTGVYAPLKNPLIDRMLLRYRRKLGYGLVPKGSAGTRNLVQALRDGRSLGLIVDRKRKDGALAPFFGRDAWTTTAPARLALKFGCPLIPIRIERLDGARFRTTIYPPLQALPGDQEQAVMDLTRQMNAAIESWIRERPDQWWCDTKRWPNKKPKQPPGRT